MPRRFQFSLRALLVVITVFGVALGWAVDRANRQRTALRALNRMGRFVDTVVDGEPRGSYNCGGSIVLVAYKRRWPAWFERLFGRDFLNDVVALELAGTDYDDDDVTAIAQLPGLRTIDTGTDTFTQPELLRLREAKPAPTIDFGIVVERE